MERTINTLLHDTGFSSWSLLETLTTTYEDTFLEFLSNSFVTQLYPSIYGEDFPDIHIQNVFPPAKPMIALAGESKFTYNLLNNYKTSPLHFRMAYIRKYTSKRSPNTPTLFGPMLGTTGLQQVSQRQPLVLPFSRDHVDSTHFQAFPVKSSAALKKQRTLSIPTSTVHNSLGKHVSVPHTDSDNASGHILSKSCKVKSLAGRSVAFHSAGLDIQTAVSKRSDSKLNRPLPEESQSRHRVTDCMSTPQTNSSVISSTGEKDIWFSEFDAALIIQSTYRMLTRRTWFITTRLAALVFQAYYRGMVARADYDKWQMSAATKARCYFQKEQDKFIDKLYKLGLARRTSSLTYDAFIFARHKFNEPVVSYFMPVCYDRVERILFDNISAQQTGSLQLRPYTFTIPILLLSAPSAISEDTAALLNSYSTPSMAFSFCMLSIMHFLLDPMVARLIVIAEHPVSHSYIESIFDGISQESILLKKNRMLTNLLRPLSPTIQLEKSQLCENKTLSVTPGPQFLSASPSPAGRVSTSFCATIGQSSGVSRLENSAARLLLPTRLSTLVKEKLIVLHPTLLKELDVNLIETPIHFSYTGSVASLLLSSPDTIRELRCAVDKAYLDVLHCQSSSSATTILPYFISNTDSLSDYDIYSLNKVFELPVTMLQYSQRINCRDYVLSSINSSTIFSVESISELHKYLHNTKSIATDTEYIISPFAPGAANVFSEATLYGLAGMRSYIFTRESEYSKCIGLYPLLPVTNIEQPDTRIVENIWKTLRLGEYYILAIKKNDAHRAYIAARLTIYIELAEKSIVTYLGSCIDISAPLSGTLLPTRSFGTISPAPDSVYLALKKKSVNVIENLIARKIYGLVTLHYLYSECSNLQAKEDTLIDNITIQSASIGDDSPVPLSPVVISPVAQSVNISPAPQSNLSVKDYAKIYDNEVAHFNSLLSPAAFGTLRKGQSHSSITAQATTRELTPLSTSDEGKSAADTIITVLVNISFGFTPGINHVCSAMALADLSWDSINGTLTRNNVSLIDKQLMKTPMIVLSLPFLWHRDLQNINRTSFMTKLMKEGIAFDSFTRTGTLFDWNSKSSSFGVFGIYRDPLQAVQHMIRLVDITLGAIHSAHSTSISSVMTKLNSLHCESEVNGKAYAQMRTMKMTTNLLDCNVALKAMVPYL